MTSAIIITASQVVSYFQRFSTLVVLLENFICVTYIDIA